jgi:protein-S-isoprenylcysteine O-methyltransferase Ste14
MTDSSFRLGVEAVLNLLKAHSRKHKRSKPVTTKLERLAGWASVAAGVIVVAGETLRQAGNLKSPPWHWIPISVIVAGVVIFFASVLVILIECVFHPCRSSISRDDGRRVHRMPVG